MIYNHKKQRIEGCNRPKVFKIIYTNVSLYYSDDYIDAYNIL